MTRCDGRRPDQIRSVEVETGFAPYAEGSVLIRFGRTRVLCTASVDPRVPRWLEGQGKGWITAEYGMLPRSTDTRIDRSRALSSGRTHEIQRLIGRSLRAVADLEGMPEVQVILDCDVLHADGGTRTAAITGSWIALAIALDRLGSEGRLLRWPLVDQVAAVSVGITGSEILLDLCYEEDSTAEVDANVVMTGKGGLVEVQGTAEGKPFSRPDLERMLDLASAGLEHLFEVQREALERIGIRPSQLAPK